MRHFFLETPSGQAPVPGEKVTLDRQESHHLATVLRGGRQNEVILTDGRGHRFEAKVISRDRHRVELEVVSVQREANEFRAPVLVLALSLIKAKRFEWALEKAVELGVHRVVPLIAEHSAVDAGQGKVQRWQTIMKSAIKQCGRSYLPSIQPPVRFSDFLADPPSGLVFFGAIAEEIGPGQGPPPLDRWLKTPPAERPDSLTVMIGPEGGWSTAEVAQMLKKDLQPISLGPHILRAETAATASLAGLQLLRQNWQSLT